VRLAAAGLATIISPVADWQTTPSSIAVTTAWYRGFREQRNGKGT
jgi:hypothetical protein